MSGTFGTLKSKKQGFSLAGIPVGRGAASMAGMFSLAVPVPSRVPDWSVRVSEPLAIKTEDVDPQIMEIRPVIVCEVG